MDEVFSGGMTEAQRLAGVDKRRQEVLQDACMLEERARKQKDPEKAQMLARLALWHKGTTRIVDFEPKQGGAYYNRIYFVDHVTFDLDEECKIISSLHYVTSTN
jgi:hypothetical protein